LPIVVPGAGINAAELADAHALADHRAGLNARSHADGRVVLNHRAGANRSTLPDIDIAADDGRGMYPRRRRQRIQQLCRQSKPHARLLRLNNALALVTRSRACFAQHHNARIAGEGLCSTRRVFCEDDF